MKKVTTLAAIAAPVALGLAAQTPAHAQIQGKLSAKVGLASLLTSSGRDATDVSGLNLGISYAPKGRDMAGRFGYTAIDLDYNHNSGKGGHVDTLGVFAIQRMHLGRGGAMVPYWGFGLGLQNTDVKVSVAPALGSTGGSTPTETVRGAKSRAATVSGSDSNIQIVGRVLVGLNLSERFYAEATYTYGGTAFGTRSDTITGALGMRF